MIHTGYTVSYLVTASQPAKTPRRDAAVQCRETARRGVAQRGLQGLGGVHSTSERGVKGLTLHIHFRDNCSTRYYPSSASHQHCLASCHSHLCRLTLSIRFQLPRTGFELGDLCSHRFAAVLAPPLLSSHSHRRTNLRRRPAAQHRTSPLQTPTQQQPSWSQP